MFPQHGSTLFPLGVMAHKCNGETYDRFFNWVLCNNSSIQMVQNCGLFGNMLMKEKNLGCLLSKTPMLTATDNDTSFQLKGAITNRSHL